MRVAIYCRISDDKTGEAAGVARQEADCRAYCEAQGYTVVGVYTDNDISASQYGKKVRPEYRKLLKAAEAGEIDGIVAFHMDRLIRKPTELEELINLADKIKIHTLSGEVDLSSETGRLVGRILGAVAANESDAKSRRIKAATKANAEAGKFLGGIRPFGYEADGITIIPVEADALKEAMKRVFDGEGLNGIAKDFNARGITSVKGKSLSAQSLRQALLSPRIAGFAVHKGEVIGEGKWEAIITPEEHERLKLHFEASSSQFSSVPRARTHLLSGIIVCDLCGQPMAAKYVSRNGKRTIRYICAPKPNNPDACGKVAIKGEPIEAFITLAVVNRLTSADVYRKADDTSGQKVEKAKEVTELQAKITKLEDDYYSGDVALPEKRFKELHRKLNLQFEEAKRELLSLEAEGLVYDLPSTFEGLAAMWATKPLEWKRTLIASVADEIRIKRSDRVVNQTTPDSAYAERVAIRWH